MLALVWVGVSCFGVGVPEAPGARAGRSVGFTGRVDGTAHWVVSGGLPVDLRGSGTVEDVDGDGLDDLVVGSTGLDGSSYGGTLSVFLGSTTGLVDAGVQAQRTDAEYFGTRVFGAGDVNGDGRGDVLACDTDEGGAGTCWAYHGGASGLDGTAATTLEPTYSGRSFGLGAAALGDVDGDGFDDVLVADDYRYAETVSLYLGSAAGLSTTPSALYNTPAGYMYFGYHVTGVGDVNGDGHPDAAIGAYDEATEAFVLLLYFGYAGGLPSEADQVIAGEDGAPFGTSVDGAGDVDGDGYEDIVVGGIDSREPGAVYLFRGGPDGVESTPWSTVSGTEVGDEFGVEVAGVGDINADGHPDIAVGAPYGEDGRGSITLFYVGPEGLDTASSIVWTGDREDDLLGGVAAQGGDIDGDGVQDVLTVASGLSDNRIYLRFGDESGVDAEPDQVLYGQDGGDFLGASVRPVGDVDGDGYDEIVVAATGAFQSIGEIRVFHGAATGLETEPRDVFDEGEEEALQGIGLRVAGPGDVDGDGFADVAIGAFMEQGQAGEVWIYPGSASGLPASPAQVFVGDGYYRRLGAAIAGPGDLDGDGYPDLAVGAYGLSSPGEVWLYRGGPSGLPSLPSSVLAGTGSASDYLGNSLAGAGDVDGDGLLDLIAGAPRTSYAAIFGGGTTPVLMTEVLPTSAQSTFGYEVAGGADFDGDGYDDVVVSCMDDAGDLLDIYRGGTGGPAEVPDQVIRTPSDLFTVGAPLDVDGDGFGDLAIGVQGSANVGEVALYVGSSAGLGDTPSESFVSPGEGGYFGYDVALSGDPADPESIAMLVGAPMEASGAGRVYLLGGGWPDVDGDGFDSATDCDDADPVVGTTSTWFADADADGFGDPATSRTACPEAGWVADGTDCDDTDASVHPGATEVEGDGIDQDCDGLDGVEDDVEPGETGSEPEQATDTGDGKRGDACSCAGAPAPLPVGVWVLALAAARRRRSGR